MYGEPDGFSNFAELSIECRDRIDFASMFPEIEQFLDQLAQPGDDNWKLQLSALFLSYSIRYLRHRYKKNALNEYEKKFLALVDTMYLNRDQGWSIYTKISKSHSFEATLNTLSAHCGVIFSVTWCGESRVYWHPHTYFTPKEYVQIYRTGIDWRFPNHIPNLPIGSGNTLIIDNLSLARRHL